MDNERPKLARELAAERYEAGDRSAFDSLPRPSHCDSRILHLPAECEFCAEATELQEERERLGVSNSGHANRMWPCPADQARSKANYSAWRGNRPATYAQVAEEGKAFGEALARAMGDDQDPGDE